MDCVVIEWARERFLDRRQKIRHQQQLAGLHNWLNLEPVLIATPTGIETSDWRTLNPDEDDKL